MSKYIGLRFVAKKTGGYSYSLYSGYFEKFIKSFSNMLDAMRYIGQMEYRILYYQEQ